ncbi:MAG: hypothetical protein IPI35_11510 [Deltaproteobacteria bacterium]|nr:hypothetical protein [Deltaproteobacteria bacterium]
MRLRAPALLLLPLLAACSDYDINPKDDVVQPLDSEPLEESPPIDDSDEPPAEDCDGLDNDADGNVDEGFGDVDLDGLADCLDSECTLGARAREPQHLGVWRDHRHLHPARTLGRG